MPSPVQQAAAEFQASQEAAMAAERLARSSQDEEDAARADAEQAPIDLGEPARPAPLVPRAELDDLPLKADPPKEETPDGDFKPISATLRRSEPEPVDPPAEDPDDDDTPARRALSGKYVILVLDTESSHNGWDILRGDSDPETNVTALQMYGGNRDTARAAALDDERNKALADAVRADYLRWQLVAIPATSWAPSPMEPRLVKTTWRVVA